MKQYFTQILSNATKTQKIIFWITLLVAVFIRLVNYFELSYYNDELSALLRVQEADFSDLISYGENVNDEHPMLIQGLLFIWTSIVGYKEWIVKLPYLLTSFITLILLFEIGSKWSKSIATGLLLMAFFSVMQLHVLFSSSIRMYISGLLFILLLVKHLWIWFEDSEVKMDKHYIISCLGFTLSAYNHHIGLMAVFLVWCTGFFFLSKAKVKLYLFIPLICVVLYAPILPMTYQQVFGYKGLTWMGKPGQGVLKQFILNLFHFEWYYVALFVIPFSIGLFLNKVPNKKITISMSWLVLSYLMIYYYTMYGSPIFQNHLFFFVLPFSFLFVFSTITQLLGEKRTSIFIILVLALGFYSLVFQRKHLEFTPKRPYGELLKDTKNALSEITDNDSLLVVHTLNTRYSRFYFSELENKPVKILELSDSLGLGKKDISNFKLKFFKNYDKIILLNPPLYFNNFLFKEYAEYKKPQFGFLGSRYFFKRRHTPSIDINQRKKISREWNFLNAQHEESYKLIVNEEWGPMKYLYPESNSKRIDLTLRSKNRADFFIVFQVEDKKTKEIVDYKTEIISADTVYKTSKISFDFKSFQNDTSKFSHQIYVWNNKKEIIEFEELSYQLFSDGFLKINKEIAHYYPEIIMEYDPLKSYGFSIELEEDSLSNADAFIYALVSCEDTTYSFFAEPILKFAKTESEETKLIGAQIQSVSIKKNTIGCVAKFGVFNPGVGTATYSNPVIKTYDRNPVFYGLVEKID